MVAEGQNPKIVVSYRRSDSAMAGRIFDRLVLHFGKTNLFIDIDNVPFGVDFRKHIDDARKSSASKANRTAMAKLAQPTNVSPRISVPNTTGRAT